MKTTTQQVLGLVISLAILFAVVWFVSKAWAAGQK